MTNSERAILIAGFAKARAKHEEITVEATDRAVYMRVAMPDGTAFSAHEDWRPNDDAYEITGRLLAQVYAQVFAAHRERVREAA